MVESNGNKPDLIFSQGQLEGFTSAGVQGFSDLNPAAIVRELIQNSLDAVRESGREKATVHFELEKVPLDDVPAIESYRDAVRSAEKDQTEFNNNKLPDQAKAVLDAINSCLDGDQIEILSILDNGIGLDEQRMTGLLADGMSIKSGTSSGAVGNGHLTAIPASNLRYILYGGVSGNKNRIAAGHAILASFKRNGLTRGKDGYYVLGIDNSLMKGRYDFPSGRNIAPLIEGKLDWIEKKSDSGSGAAVIIPGFNRFREQTDLWEVIKEAAACSFFVAIADDDLEITYKDYVEGTPRILNKSNIKEVFNETFVSQRRAGRRAKGFLSGKRAYEAYITTTECLEERVDVGCGEIGLLIRNVAGGPSRIDLCRNGMWITDRLPRLQTHKFNDRKPFHCLIKVTSQDEEIHRLIRKSEGPLHNSIEASKWLAKDEKSLFDNAFKKISEHLEANLEKLELKTFHISDALSVVSAKGMKNRHYTNSFEVVPPRIVRTLPSGPKTQRNGDGVSVREGESGSGYGTKTVSASKGNSVNFQAILVPTGLRSCNVELRPYEELRADSKATIWFVLDENIDETCDSTSKYKEQRVKLKAVKLNGESVPKDNLIKGSDGDIEGVSLDQLKAGTKLSFDYDPPNGVSVRATDNVVLRAEIVCHRRKIS